jgi:arylsulfatase
MMLLAPGACHAPHQAPLEYINRCEPYYKDGWDAVRERRLARQIELGIVPPGTPMPPRNDFVFPWEDIPAEQKPLSIRLMAAYAAMLEHFDDHFARVIQHLEASGQLENTVVLVMSVKKVEHLVSLTQWVRSISFKSQLTTRLRVSTTLVDQTHIRTSHGAGHR